MRQRPAKPCTRVRFPSPPPHHNFTRSRAISSVGERFPDTEEVTGSIPVSRTTVRSVSPGSSARGFPVSSGLYRALGALLCPWGVAVSAGLFRVSTPGLVYTPALAWPDPCLRPAFAGPSPSTRADRAGPENGHSRFRTPHTPPSATKASCAKAGGGQLTQSATTVPPAEL